MKVKQLIKCLEILPQNYDVRIDYGLTSQDFDEMVFEDLLNNRWVDSVQFIKKGSSGYEEHGEVVIFGSE